MSWFRALLIGVGIPLGLAGIVFAGTEKYESLWRAALTAQFGPLPADVAALTRLESLCQDPRAVADLQEICRDTIIGGWLLKAAIAAAIVSLVLLLLIALGSRYAGTNRPRLAAVFKPLLVIVELGLVFVILAEGAALTGGAYIFEVAYFEYFTPYVIAIFALVAVLAAAGVFGALIRINRRTPMKISGTVLVRAAEPELFELIDDVATRSGAEGPGAIVAGLDPTFFVVDTLAEVDGRRTEGRLLYLSVPLLRVMSIDELRAIVGHELGHYLGEDTAYSQRFGPIYRSASEAFLSVAAAAGGFSGLVLRPSLEILGALISRFSTVERAVSRTRELEADLVGANVSSGEDVATSLIKMHAYAGTWLDVLNHTAESAQPTGGAVAIGSRFADRVRFGATARALETLENAAPTHPLDSHPPLADRLDHLGIKFDAVADVALSGLPGIAAATVLADSPGLEERLLSEYLASRTEGSGTFNSEEAEADLRDVAATSRDVAEAISIIEQAYGGLFRPRDFRADWVALFPMSLIPHPDPKPFASIIKMASLPGGDQLLIMGIASAQDGADGASTLHRQLPVGSKLRLIGINDPAERAEGWLEDIYLWDNSIVVVQSVGTGDVRGQLAGLFVVPETEPLAAPDGPWATAISTLADRLAAWTAAYVPEDDDDEPETDPEPQPVPNLLR